MNNNFFRAQGILGSLTSTLTNVVLVAISISIVHFIGYFLGNFPLSFGQMLDPDFYLWFTFQLFLAAAIASLVARLINILVPFCMLFIMLTIGAIVVMASKEKKKLIKSIMTYPKRTKYLEEIHISFKVVSYVLGFFLFSSIYLGEHMWGFVVFVSACALVFLIYFVNTNFRSFARFKRQIHRLRYFRIYVLRNNFSVSLLLLLVLAATANAGSIRFEKLVHETSISVVTVNGSSNFAIVGFIMGSPIKVKKSGVCLEFSVRLEGEVFRDNKCEFGIQDRNQHD